VAVDEHPRPWLSGFSRPGTLNRRSGEIIWTSSTESNRAFTESDSQRLALLADHATSRDQRQHRDTFVIVSDADRRPTRRTRLSPFSNADKTSAFCQPPTKSRSCPRLTRLDFNNSSAKSTAEKRKNQEYEVDVVQVPPTDGRPAIAAPEVFFSPAQVLDRTLLARRFDRKPKLLVARKCASLRHVRALGRTSDAGYQPWVPAWPLKGPTTSLVTQPP
jgi:hypothetical protein